MTQLRWLFRLILFVNLPLFNSSCITEKDIYKSASGEKEIAKWRLLARAREQFDPYIKWKKDLIKELYAGSNLVDTKKGPIEYAINGDSGPYLIVMHGEPGGYDQTAALFSDMFGKGFRIISWSRPGYVRTPLEVAKTIGEQADAAGALLDALNIDRVAVLGYSAGGPPAITFSSRYPERTWALILECAVTRKWVDSSDNLQRELYFGYLMYQDPFLWSSDVVGTYAPRMIGMSTIEMESSLDKQETKKLMDNIMNDPKRVKVLTGMMKSMSPSGLRQAGVENDIEQLKQVKDLPLKDINAPTLIIHGTNDADVSVEDAKYAAKTIPHVELYLVPGGFHIMALTDSIDRITQKRVNFLQEHAPNE
jgi:pimeloyl-ACP methyl ester carboxylesterase